jgi:hypothetical protein
MNVLGHPGDLEENNPAASRAVYIVFTQIRIRSQTVKFEFQPQNPSIAAESPAHQSPVCALQ